MNKLKILKQWQAATDALNKASEHLLKFGMGIESETVSAVHEATDEMTRLASAAVGDAFDWLSWYQYHNEMGARGLQATADGETKEIRTLEDLRNWRVAMTDKTNKGGRPTIILTDEQVAQVEALGAVLSIEQIADYFGISKTTFYAIMERQPEVGERYKKGKAKAIGSVAQGLLQQAREGNTSAAMFYLKTQAGWRETQHIDHTTQGEKITSQDRGEAVMAAIRARANSDDSDD